MHGEKFPVWATIITIISIGILCTLGTWQIKRLHWKEGLLADIEQAYQVDPARNLIGSADIMTAYTESRLVLRGTAIGRYLPKTTFKLGPRPHDGAQGYHVYTPLKLLDGGTLLINRGWMPQEANMPPPPQGTVRVTGLLRKPDPANRFTPINSPVNNEWYTIDLAEVAAVKSLTDLAPYVLYAEGAAESNTPLITVGQKPELYNNHRAYAIFWFMMAGLMVLFYGLRFRPWARREL